MYKNIFFCSSFTHRNQLLVPLGFHSSLLPHSFQNENWRGRIIGSSWLLLSTSSLRSSPGEICALLKVQRGRRAKLLTWQSAGVWAGLCRAAGKGSWCWSWVLTHRSDPGYRKIIVSQHYHERAGRKRGVWDNITCSYISIVEWQRQNNNL